MPGMMRGIRAIEGESVCCSNEKGLFGGDERGGLEECLGFVPSLQSRDKSSDIIQMHPFPGHDAGMGARRRVGLLHLSPVGTLQNDFFPPPQRYAF